mgnify:FL=1
MKRLAIAGGGDLGRQIAHLAVQIGGYLPMLYDDTLEIAEGSGDHPVQGKIADIAEHFQAGAVDAFIIGIGYKHITERDRLFRHLSETVPAATLVHPTASIDPNASIDSGTALMAGCIVDQGASVGKNCYLNPGCLISHHTHVSDNVFMGPRVTLAGFVDVASHCFLGVSTTVIDNVKIAQGVQTGAGAVVTNSISNEGLYLGVPAKIKNNR